MWIEVKEEITPAHTHASTPRAVKAEKSALEMQMLLHTTQIQAALQSAPEFGRAGAVAGGAAADDGRAMARLRLSPLRGGGREGSCWVYPHPAHGSVQARLGLRHGHTTISLDRHFAFLHPMTWMAHRRVLACGRPTRVQRGRPTLCWLVV